MKDDRNMSHVAEANRRLVNARVAEYRRIALKRAVLDLDDELLSIIMRDLGSDELEAYVTATQEIEEALTDTLDLARQSRWAYSTTKQALSRAANAAGLDRGGAR